MYNGGKIIFGLIVFVGIVTVPVWFQAGAAAPRPELPKATGECILPAEEMRANHMMVLEEWRQAVVRRGDRLYKRPDGTTINRSLTHTCLKCHTDRQAFCDRCHDYAAVTPTCWDCHLDQKGSR